VFLTQNGFRAFFTANYQSGFRVINSLCVGWLLTHLGRPLYRLGKKIIFVLKVAKAWFSGDFKIEPKTFHLKDKNSDYTFYRNTKNIFNNKTAQIVNRLLAKAMK